MYKDTNINMVSLVSMVLNRVLLNCDIEYLKTESKITKFNKQVNK